MSNKKKPPLDPDFDSTIPEEGATVPVDTGTDKLFANHLPSAADRAIAARESFGYRLPEHLIQDLMRSSTGVINDSPCGIVPMYLGFKFSVIMRTVQHAYIASRGDSPRTLRRANKDAFSYIEEYSRFSNSMIRLYLNAYARFHNNPDAVEFLRLTDMQLLLGKDIGNDIVNTIIERRKASPDMSTREVKKLIAALRQKQDDLPATPLTRGCEPTHAQASGQ